MFSENGEGSSTRVFTGFLIFAATAWISFLVFVNHAIPDITGIIGLIGVLYGINKAASAVEAFKK